MERSMLQTYVIGSDKAVPMYEKAFGAKLISSYLNDDGTYYHSELDIEGEILSVAERNVSSEENQNTVTGNTMQFCLEYGEGGEEKIQKAYEVLKEGAQIHTPPSPCEYSPLIVDLTDTFGVRWCLFV